MNCLPADGLEYGGLRPCAPRGRGLDHDGRRRPTKRRRTLPASTTPNTSITPQGVALRSAPARRQVHPELPVAFVALGVDEPPDADGELVAPGVDEPPDADGELVEPGVEEPPDADGELVEPRVEEPPDADGELVEPGVSEPPEAGGALVAIPPAPPAPPLVTMPPVDPPIAPPLDPAVTRSSEYGFRV